jgi:hypothetical protein
MIVGMSNMDSKALGVKTGQDTDMRLKGLTNDIRGSQSDIRPTPHLSSCPTSTIRPPDSILPHVLPVPLLGTLPFTKPLTRKPSPFILDTVQFRGETTVLNTIKVAKYVIIGVLIIAYLKVKNVKKGKKKEGK